MTRRTLDSIRDDEDLSALLDGELPPDREGRLRRRLVDEPELAQRLGEMGALTGELSALAEAEVEPRRIDRMHAALRARIDAEGSDADAGGEAEVIPLRAYLRRGVPMAVAAAAALALYLALGRTPLRTPDPVPEFAKAPRQETIIEEVSPPSLFVPEEIQSQVALEGADGAGPGVVAEKDGGDLAESSQRVARSQSTTSSTENAGQVPGLEMPGSKAPAEALEEYRDEEIAIAFDYEMLIDYEVIENLELLELIDTAEFTEQI